MSGGRVRHGAPRWVAAALALLATASPAQEPREEPAYLIVVHPDVTGKATTRALLEQIFLKEVQRWGDGQSIAAVDQSLRAPVRASFSQDVLGQTPQQVLSYWRRQISTGRRPPMVKESDVDVLEYVAATPGAIGYVAPTAELDTDSVRILEISASEE